MAEIRAKAVASGAQVVDERRPQQNLERFFLNVTGGSK
jgi:hypothetical protein